MPNNGPSEQLNSVKYVFLRELVEPRDNSLCLVVEEAIDNEFGVVTIEQPELQHILKGAHPIESVDGCKKFELYWKHYVAYLVTEELVGSNAVTGHDDEAYSGRILRVYSRSHFLDHILRDTGGHTDEVRHYKLICLNHLIDVAAYGEPEIRVLTTAPNS